MYKLVLNKMTQKIECINKQEGDVLLSIPFNPDNTDYQKYLKWVEEGNTPEPADQPE